MAVYEEEKPQTEPVTSSPKEPAPRTKPVPKVKEQGTVNPLVGFARALDCYEKAAKLAPEDDKILNRLADLYIFNKLYDKAVPIYLKILELRPNSVNVREKLALSYVAQDDKKKAISQIEEIVKKEPLKFKYYIMLGELYLDASRGEKDEKPREGQETERQKLLGKALDKFQQAVVLNPNEVEPQLNIAYIYLLLKKPDQSIAALDKAKEKFPTNPKVFYFYGLSYSDAKQYDKAMRAFADAIAMVDDSTEGLLDSTFYFYYGAACERAGNIETAAEQFRKSIEMNPENAEAYNYLGYMWADKGIKLNEALDYIRKAIEFEPDNGAYVDSLGWVYFKLGKYDDALKELRRAATLMKDPDPEVYNHIAEVYMRMGKKKDAIEHWQKAIAVDPENKDIAAKLKQAQEAK
jgi:tetratricopeptide (TPR) repeat protein